MSDPLASPEFRSPLFDLNLPGRAGAMNSRIGVAATEITGRAYITLRGSLTDEKFAEATANALTTPLPGDPCTVKTIADASILWLSPDEWMITGPRASMKELLSKLQLALSGLRGLATDNSSGYTEIFMSGGNADVVLSHCTVYRLHDLTPGRVVGTTFGKVQVYLRRDRSGYSILVRRSFADYVWRFLERASKPYGFGVRAENAERGFNP